MGGTMLPRTGGGTVMLPHIVLRRVVVALCLIGCSGGMPCYRGWRGTVLPHLTVLCYRIQRYYQARRTVLPHLTVLPSAAHKCNALCR